MATLIDLPDPVTLYSNDTWDWTLVLTQPAEDDQDPDEAVDLTGASLRAHLRPTPESPHVALELSTANGRLLITDAVNGEIAFNVPPAVLGAVPPGDYEIDLVVTIDGIERATMRRAATVALGITR